MKLKSILSSLAFFFLAQCVFAQEKMIQLEDIWASRTFSPERVWGINSMNDGVHYSSLNYGENNVYITQYSYETGDSISTIVDSKDLDGISFSDYSFSEDEKKFYFLQKQNRFTVTLPVLTTSYTIEKLK